ncbi:MAG: hypothetical protein V4501_02855 [Pseudomonadota bacterium]
MPLILDNENTNEIIARFVFDKNLFTVFFRITSCGIGAEGENFRAEFYKHSVLRDLRPQIIINDADPRHRHFHPRDSTLLHVHLGFDASIEHIDTVKAILQSTNQIQQNVFENWSAMEKIINAKVKYPVCGTILFSNVDNMVAIAERFFTYNNRLDLNTNLCFWRNSNGKKQNVECQNLVTDIPTDAEISESMKTTISLSQAAESMQETAVARLGQVEIMLLLLICLWLLRNLARPVTYVGFRR